jgi:hypothetical protein
MSTAILERNQKLVSEYENDGYDFEEPVNDSGYSDENESSSEWVKESDHNKVKQNLTSYGDGWDKSINSKPN